MLELTIKVLNISKVVWIKKKKDKNVKYIFKILLI